MENFKLYNKFIDNIDENIIEILNNNALNYINKLYDNKCTILYGNELFYLQHISEIIISNVVKYDTVGQRLDYLLIKDKNKIKSNYLTTNDCILQSKYHYEISLFNENVCKFISSIIKNKNINNEKYIFLIKDINKKYEFMLKKLIDDETNSQFIFISNSLSKLNETTKSRSLCVNCSFSFGKVKEYIYNNSGITIERLSYTLFTTFIEAEMEGNNYLETYIHNFLNKKTPSLCELKRILTKIYNLSLPYKIINKIILDKYKDKDYIHEIVKILAEQNTLSFDNHLIHYGDSSYNMLTLERIFMNIFLIVNNK